MKQVSSDEISINLEDLEIFKPSVEGLFDFDLHVPDYCEKQKIAMVFTIFDSYDLFTKFNLD